MVFNRSRQKNKRQKTYKQKYDKMALMSIKNPFIDQMYKDLNKVKQFVSRNKPELKYNIKMFQLSNNLEGQLSFTTSWPNNWGDVDVSPGSGLGDTQRVGNTIRAQYYKVDLNVVAQDDSTKGRFYIIRWKNPLSPDATPANYWPNPLYGSPPNEGALANVWYTGLKSNDYFDILYKKDLTFKAYPTTNQDPSGYGYAYGRTAPINIKKTIQLKGTPINYTVAGLTYPNTLVDGTGTDQTSYKGRIYCFITTNVIESNACDLYGTVQMGFTDS